MTTYRMEIKVESDLDHITAEKLLRDMVSFERLMDTFPGNGSILVIDESMPPLMVVAWRAHMKMIRQHSMSVFWKWHSRRGCLSKSYRYRDSNRSVWDWGWEPESRVYHLGPIKLMMPKPKPST